MPTPRRVSSTPARSSSPYTFATVFALIFRSTASCRTVGSLSPRPQPARRDRHADRPFELGIQRRSVRGVDRKHSLVSYCSMRIVQVGRRDVKGAFEVAQP